MSPRRIDLHTHSTASDGLLSPTELVTEAHQAGLGLIALTDHDSVDGVIEAREAGGRLGVEVVAGIEINTDLVGHRGEVHVLGYFVDTAQAAFQATLRTLREKRATRGEQMVAQLRAAGCDVTWEEVQALAKGAVGRPHVARVLVAHGYAHDISDAFARWLSPGMPGYVERMKLSQEQAIRLINSAGGVAAIAHPADIPGLEETVVPALTAAGLSGLECFYGQYDDATVSRLVTLAKAHALVPTGGSDYHGKGIHPTSLGGRFVPPEAVDRLRERAEQLRRQTLKSFSLGE